MGLFTTQQAPLSSSTKAAGATKSQIFAIQTEGKTSTLVSNVLSSHQDQLNQIASILRNPPPPLTALGVTDPNGMLIAWIGDREVNGVQYEGGYFANLYIGGTDPTNAVIVIDGQDAQITINDNGSIEILDPNNDVTAEIGTIYDATYGITSISAVTAPVVTLAATPAIPFTTGDTVIHAGDTVPQYNGNFTITVLTPTTYTMNGVTNHGAGTGGTARRYFSGVAGERAAFGGDPFSPFSANIKTQADGSVIINVPQNNVSTIIGNTVVLGSKIAGFITQDDTSKVETLITPESFYLLDASGDILGIFNYISGFGSNLTLNSDSTVQYSVNIAAAIGSASIVSTYGPAGSASMGVTSSAVQAQISGTSSQVATLAPTQLSISDGVGDVLDLNTTTGLTFNFISATGSLTPTTLTLNGGVVIDKTDLTFASVPAVTVGSGNVGQATVFPVAKLTGAGSNGSLTFVAGVMTAFTAPT